MKNIFYYINVPWDWIKQRPQFIAEELAKDFRIEVFQEKNYHSKNLSSNHRKIQLTTLFRLPLSRFYFIKKLNDYLILLQLCFKIKRFDYIWLSSPLQYATIKKIIKKDQFVIYDCMDDYFTFPEQQIDQISLSIIKKNEPLLLQRANKVFCSSLNLKEKLITRNQTIDKDKIYVVNNGITIYSQEEEVSIPNEIREVFKKYPLNLCYIGTISEWFDFQLLTNTIDKHENLALILFGPIDIQLPKHERIIHLGAVPHQYIYGIMREAGVMIMPFLLNDLIYSVNPVKLYEYIYCKKIIIARKYPEVLKFEDYVYLYDNDAEFAELITNYCKKELSLKKEKEEYINFGFDNTWSERVKEFQLDI